jgi:hypothetical protein
MLDRNSAKRYLIIRLVAVAANRLQPPNFTWNCVKFFAVAMAMPAKLALFHIKFAAVSLDRRHRNKSIIDKNMIIVLC